MKLYTRDQVLKMLEVCRDSDLYEHILTFEDILKTETPIELPSDDEMEKEMIKWGLGDIGQRMGYRLGIKDFRNKIKGGNNEQQ